MLGLDIQRFKIHFSHQNCKISSTSHLSTMDSMITFLSPTKGRRPRSSLGSDPFSEEATTASPEIHRLAFLLFLKLLAPSILHFLATETPLTTILGIWYPIILSFYMLQRHQQSHRLSLRAKANERRLWLHYWSMMASWQFLRRSIIDPALQSTFGVFFLMPRMMKQSILSSLAQLELCACVLLLYPIIYAKTWDGTIRLTTSRWNKSSCVYRLWERHVLSKIVTRETTLSLLSDALLHCSSAPSQATTNMANDDGTSAPATPSAAANEGDHQETSYWKHLETIVEKACQLAARLVALAQWLGLLSEGTVKSTKALWSKACSVAAGLVLPPLFLAVMPASFCSELGLQYLHWIYTASQSLKAASPHYSRDDDMVRNGTHDDGYNFLLKRKQEGKRETYWLQYWIIHTTVVFGGLDYVSSQLPFWFKGLVSWNFWWTLAWIWLLHDSWVVQSLYGVFESELVGLGLVPEDSSSPSYGLEGQNPSPRANISETNTAKFAQYILEQLPRAECASTKPNSLARISDGEPPVDSRGPRGSACAGDQYPDLTEASSALSSESSDSLYSPSTSPVMAGKTTLCNRSARERSVWTCPPPASLSTSDDSLSTPPQRTKERRKKVLLRYRQHHLKSSSPTNTSARP